jgi:5'-3' exonuclease
MVQLIDEHTQLYSPIKKVIIDVHNCEQHLPVHVHKYLLYKSILGDASDCIKGLPGYGKVKAKKLAENYELDFAKLSTQLQQQQLHNMRMMNLNQGLVEHPEERACYEQQLQRISLTAPPYPSG